MDGHLEATAAASRGEVIGADVGHSPETGEVVAALPRFAASVLDHRDRLGSPLHVDGVRYSLRQRALGGSCHGPGSGAGPGLGWDGGGAGRGMGCGAGSAGSSVGTGSGGAITALT